MSAKELVPIKVTRSASTVGTHASFLGILTTLFGALLCISLSGCSSDPGKLSINVDADGWQGGAVSISVQGKSDKGDTVSKTISVKPGEEFESKDLVAGSYTFDVSSSSLKSGETIYAVSSVDDTRDDSKNQHVTISLGVDQQATDNLAAEKAAAEQKAAEEAAAKQKAEEEAAAKKAQEEAEAKKSQEEAEAKKQAEEAAAQKAAQEKKAAAASSSSGATNKSSSVANSQTVYVTKTGKKYHNDGCSSLRKSKIPMSLSEAQAQGYTPCKNCH